MSTAITLIIAGVLITIATASALNALSSTQTLPATGMLTQMHSSVNVAVFTDAACTQNASAVNWGTLSPGLNTTKIFYVKNLGNVTSRLSLSTDDWTPSNAYPAINLDWNQEGTILAPGEIVQATLTLTVSPTIDANVTSFNFNIMITGTG
ncbi:MAG TPA: hypothetical protein VMD05_11370 [Candidatus Nanoarchaeia archaeon]|nr:hypothetical protein [Candidatus Nanoarchaeia archaeon]